jgi:3-oxoacyl-[acyl-carrier-protein] synthase II
MANRSRTRVVITGMAIVSPLGNSLSNLWSALVAGQSGVRRLVDEQGRDIMALPCGAQAADFTGEIGDFGTLDKERTRAIRKGLKLMCREIQMGVAVAQLALQHGQLQPGRFDPERTGVVYGCDHIVTDLEEFVEGIQACLEAENGKELGSRHSSIAMAQSTGIGLDTWPKVGLHKVTPLWLLKYLPNMPASHIAIYNDLRGPNNSITYREASGNLAVGEACATIQRGSADCMLAGATGCHIHPLKSIYLGLQQQMARYVAAPEEMSRPFDLERTGQVAGEGAAALLLESEAHARARGATIYGEVLGHGSAVAMDRQGRAELRTALAGAAKAALRTAEISPDQLGHIHAHGLATQWSDAEEARALGDVCGGSLPQIPVVAAKSYFGNLGAGGGLAELICSLLALQHNQLFPILNYQTPDPECPIRAVTDDNQAAGRTALNLSVTAQGQASAVVIGAA